MPSRVSSRLAAKTASSPVADKGNSPEELSSPSTMPAPAKKKAVVQKKAASQASDPTRNSDDVVVTSKSTNKPKGAPNGSDGKGTAKHEDTTLPVTKGTKRKRASPVPKMERNDEELPHDMGRRAPAKPKIKEESNQKAISTPKTRRAATSVQKQEQDQDTKEVAEDAEGRPRKKAKKKARKKANPYGLTPGETPFPDWPHPAVDECKTVHDLLMSTIKPERRKRFLPPDDIPAPSEVVAGCGEVPSILDALIRTLLSAATNGKNSSNAFQGLVQRFGLARFGLGKGSVNWNAVHEAPVEEVFEAIKSGGLAKNKSKNIKKILEVVHAENKERLATLLKSKAAGEFDQMDDNVKAEKELELRTLRQGVLTLDYYHVLEKDDAITTFTALPGIGVKTAACVNLFCMQRPCFAVDTHVFRLCQYLGWVPPDDTRGEKQKKADRNATFSHCEVMIPDELKYGLHALFLEHGKNCPRCRAITGEKSEGWADANCVIEHLVKRTGAKKGGLDSSKKKAKGRKGGDSNGEASGSELSGDDQTPEKASSPTKITMEKPALKAMEARGKRSTVNDTGREDEEDKVMSDVTDEAEGSSVGNEDEDEDENDH